MWQKEHTTMATGVTAEQIWQVWSDIENWPQWDNTLEWCKWGNSSSEFKPGNFLYLKPKGAPKVKIFISEATPYKLFSDYTQFPLARMFDIHELKEVPDGVQITNTIWVRGPLAWLWRKLVAQSVADSIPQQTQNLIARAKTK